MNFSNFRRRMSAVATAGILAGTVAFGAGEAQATVYEWTVSDVIFDTGLNDGILNGTFKYDDTGGGSFSDVALNLTGDFGFGASWPSPVTFNFSLPSLDPSALFYALPNSDLLAGTPVIIISLSTVLFDTVVGTETSNIFDFLELRTCVSDGCLLFSGGPDTFFPGSELVYSSELVNVSTVPVPAALPLFGTGLAIMGFLGWRRKSKAAAA